MTLTQNVKFPTTDISWHCDLFSNYGNECFICVGGQWKQCVLYKGNEQYLEDA